MHFCYKAYFLLIQAPCEPHITQPTLQLPTFKYPRKPHVLNYFTVLIGVPIVLYYYITKSNIQFILAKEATYF